jgi:hypothetical protein
MKREERELLLDSLIDLMTANKLGGWRGDVVPFIGDDGAFGFYCGHADEGATTASVVTRIFEKGGFAPGATRDADYTMYRNLAKGGEIIASDISRVVNDEDAGFRFECRPGLPFDAVLEAVKAWTDEAQVARRRDVRFELGKVEKKISDRRRDKVTEVFGQALDEAFVTAYLIQRTEDHFKGAVADVVLQPQNWTPGSCTVVTTDVPDSGYGADFDKQSGFRWKLGEVFNDASGAVGCHSEPGHGGLFSLRITGTRARLALDILDNDLDGAKRAAETVVKQLGPDTPEAKAFTATFGREEAKRLAEQAARQGIASTIKVGGPLKLKHS